MLEWMSEFLKMANDHPTGFVIGIMGFLIVGMFYFSWQIWSTRKQDIADQRAVSKQLADTQEKLVNYVTFDSAQMRAALDANTKSNLAAASSGISVKGSMDALFRKLGSDPGCKVLDPKLMCKAQELGVTKEEFVELVKTVKENQAAILSTKEEATSHLEAIRDEAIAVRKVLEAKATEDKRSLDEKALEAAKIVLNASAERRKIHDEKDAEHAAALKEELHILVAKPSPT